MRDAVMNKDARAVKYILSKDASLVSYQDRQAETMLHLACIFNLSEIARELLLAGASTTAKNSHGETALDIALPALRTKLLELCEGRR